MPRHDMRPDWKLSATACSASLAQDSNSGARTPHVIFTCGLCLPNSACRRHQFRSRGSRFRASQVLGILQRPGRVVLLKVSAIDGVPNLFVPDALCPDRDFVIASLDRAARLLNKCPIPAFRLHAPGPHKDAVFHDHMPNANEAVAPASSSNAQNLAGPQSEKDFVGKMSFRFQAETRLTARLFYLDHSAFLCHRLRPTCPNCLSSSSRCRGSAFGAQTSPD